jgi:hypothetical protein
MAAQRQQTLWAIASLATMVKLLLPDRKHRIDTE